jgi:hypothetical protein
MESSRWTSLLIATGILLASGLLVHSNATDSGELEAAAARVAEVPLVIGSWHGTDDASDAASFSQAGAKSYWMRTYVHEESKASLLVILMCGRSGKMAVHTPEVCYQGAGYELVGAPKAYAWSAETPQRLWTARFDKKVGRPAQLRLYWGWNAQGNWEAAASPRWQYRGEPFLYKLYVSQERASETDAAPDFLRQFVPVLHKTLFPS